MAIANKNNLFAISYLFIEKKIKDMIIIEDAFKDIKYIEDNKKKKRKKKGHQKRVENIDMGLRLVFKVLSFII